MENSNSILDKVISSKKVSEIEQFNPSEVVSLLFKNLSGREEDVLRRRHGLLGRGKETLEKIGENYKVTRERIRQIEKSAITKIKNSKNFITAINPIERTIFAVLEQHGGIMSEFSLLGELLVVTTDNSANRQNIIFIISELLNNKFKSVEQANKIRKSWQLFHAPMSLIDDASNELLKIIESFGKPRSIKEIVEEFKKTDCYSSHQSQLNDEAIISYLDINSNISKNPFEEYGLTKWGSIVPKRMNDKIYLVLKKNEKPMHFTEITKKINEIKFDKRKAYAPTVHNELILNKKYVLVGRGIYALKEWGYQPGVVANVIVEILKESDQPLSRNDLVKKVLDQRIVKKNTIHLALTNKDKFVKHSNGKYSLANTE